MTITALSLPFPGVCRVLEEGERLGFWTFARTDASGGIEVPRSDVYLLGAWHEVYGSQLLPLLTGGKVGVLWTSSPGEMDMEPIEREMLHNVLTDPRIHFVWFGCLSLAELYPDKGFYAPYPFWYKRPVPEFTKTNTVTLLNPAGRKKNVYNQLLAMALVQRQAKDLVLVTNCHQYELEMRRLGLNYRLVDWLPQEDHWTLLGQAKTNLAVSWAETHCYSVADAALRGTSSAISHAISLPGMKVLEPNNPMSIAGVVRAMVANPSWATVFKGDVRAYANQSNATLRRVFIERGLMAP